MQVVKGNVYSHGPYKSEDARDNRFDKVRGGEIHKFNSFTPEPNQAIQEFKLEMTR